MRNWINLVEIYKQMTDVSRSRYIDPRSVPEETASYRYQCQIAPQGSFAQVLVSV
jgi:hypothetical protein